MLQVHRKADVQVVAHEDGKRHMLIIDGNDVTMSSSRSQIERNIANSDADSVAKWLSGGTFVTDNGELKEYRTSDYTGFVHSDDMIARFCEDKNLDSKAETKLVISKFGAGGEFNLSAGFDWSVFSPDLETSVGLLRLVCANGLTVREPLLSKRVPVINMYDRHLTIASQQTLKYAEEMLFEKISSLDGQRASVRDVNLALSHINARMKDAPDDATLNRLYALTAFDYGSYYTDSALSNSAITQTLPSHLDRYTLLNVVTEMSSHTPENHRSTVNAMHKIASDIILSESQVQQGQVTVTKTFQSPEVAFMG